MSPRFDSGSAPAEFVMVGALLVALTLGVIHLSFAIHVRHVLHASAWEGARHASYFGGTVASGVNLTETLIAQALGPRYDVTVRGRPLMVAGQPGVEVRVNAPLPALGLWSIGGEFDVSAAVPREIPG